MKRNNEQPSNAMYVLKIALPLTVICAVIALLVATVNYFTAPVIEKNNAENLRKAIEELFAVPGVAYEQVEVSLEEADLKTVDEVYRVQSGDEVLGYCVKLSPACFKGDVDMIVSLDKDAFVTGVKITSTNDESPGIGTKVTSPEFTGQFIETADSHLSDSYKEYVISGATKTSKPVTEAVFTAKRVVTLLIHADSVSEETPDVHTADAVPSGEEESANE